MSWLRILLPVLFLTGCVQSTVTPQTLPEITFKHLAPINFSVATIDVVDQTNLKDGRKHVEHLFPTSPAKGLRAWVRDRLQTTSSTGSITVLINEASAVETALETKSGVKGFFTNDQSERYDASLDVRIEKRDANGLLLGYASSKASRFVTVPEDASLYERERTWFNLVEGLMKDFEQTMTANLQKISN